MEPISINIDTLNLGTLAPMVIAIGSDKDENIANYQFLFISVGSIRLNF